MNDETDEYGCRPTDPEWMRQVAKDNTTENVKTTWVDDSCPEGPFAPPTTPRVAESLDDLAVGMWVAVGVAGTWSAWRIIDGRPKGREAEGALSTTQILLGHAGNTVVILADPPAPPAPEEALCVCGHRFHWPAAGYCHECGNTEDGCHQFTPATVPAPHADAEAAWHEWTDTPRNETDATKHAAFIAGYLRGRGDRG